MGVRLDEHSRGGSRFMHNLMPGDRVWVSQPCQSFPLHDAPDADTDPARRRRHRHHAARLDGRGTGAGGASRSPCTTRHGTPGAFAFRTELEAICGRAPSFAPRRRGPARSRRRHRRRRPGGASLRLRPRTDDRGRARGGSPRGLCRRTCALRALRGPRRANARTCAVRHRDRIDGPRARRAGRPIGPRRLARGRHRARFRL